MTLDLERMKEWAGAAAGHPTWSVAYAEDVPKLIAEVERLRWELDRLKADYERAVRRC
jgi:hypothetical protein